MNAVLKWFALYAILMVGYYAQNRLTVGDTLYFNTLFLKDFSEVARNTGLIFLGGFLFWYFLLRSKPHPNTFTQDDPRLAPYLQHTGRTLCLCSRTSEPELLQAFQKVLLLPQG